MNISRGMASGEAGYHAAQFSGRGMSALPRLAFGILDNADPVPDFVVHRGLPGETSRNATILRWQKSNGG